MATTFRPSHALDLVQSNLGLLGDLLGTFIGTGFNLIARPDKQNNKPFFLEVNATQEILEFTNIGGDIPNRGSVQDDVTLHGVHYLQRVADCELHSAIHLEPGLWVRVDPTVAPNPVTLRLQRLRQTAHALAGPPQRRFRNGSASDRLLQSPSTTPVFLPNFRYIKLARTPSDCPSSLDRLLDSPE